MAGHLKSDLVRSSLCRCCVVLFFSFRFTYFGEALFGTVQTWQGSASSGTTPNLCFAVFIFGVLSFHPRCLLGQSNYRICPPAAPLDWGTLGEQRTLPVCFRRSPLSVLQACRGTPPSMCVGRALGERCVQGRFFARHQSILPAKRKRLLRNTSPAFLEVLVCSNAWVGI